MALRLLTVLRRNPANYAVRWESGKYEDHLPLTPIRRAYPDAWITANVEPSGEGFVLVLTADHGASVEGQEMSRTLAQFGLPEAQGWDHLKQQVMGLVGGPPPRAYVAYFEFGSVAEGKAFVDRVIAALQNSADKFEMVGEGRHAQILLRK